MIGQQILNILQNPRFICNQENRRCIKSAVQIEGKDFKELYLINISFYVYKQFDFSMTFDLFFGKVDRKYVNIP